MLKIQLIYSENMAKIQLIYSKNIVEIVIIWPKYGKNIANNNMVKIWLIHN